MKNNYKIELEEAIKKYRNIFNKKYYRLVQGLGGKIHRNDFIIGYVQLLDSLPSLLFELNNNKLIKTNFDINDFYYNRISLDHKTYLLREDTSFRRSTKYQNLNPVFRYKILNKEKDTITIKLNDNYSILNIYNDYYTSKIDFPNIVFEIISKSFIIKKVYISNNHWLGAKFLDLLKSNNLDENTYFTGTTEDIIGQTINLFQRINNNKLASLFQ